MIVTSAPTRTAARPPAAVPGAPLAAAHSAQPALAAARPDPRQGFKGDLVRAVAVAQVAQRELEEAGRAFNAGTGTREAFATAEAGFAVALADLKAVVERGRKLAAPFWNPFGFRPKRLLRETGAEALLAYRPPRLSAGAPDPHATFKVRLAAARQAAQDGVEPLKALDDLLAAATTVAEVEEVLALGRRGRNIGHGTPLWVRSPEAYASRCYERLAALNPPKTWDERLAFLTRSAADGLDPEPALTAMLAQATTPAAVEQLLAAGRKGRDISSSSYPLYARCSRTLFEAGHARLEALNPPRTLDERLAALRHAASDGIDPTARLTALLAHARTAEELDAVVAVGRRGRNIGSYSPLFVEAPQAFFDAAHARRLQLELEALAHAASPADRVTFAQQRLPRFETADAYRNFAVKAASYALIDLQDVLAARQAFAAGTLAARELQAAEESLDEAMRLVAALRQAPAAGFDARAFWERYQLEATVAAALGEGRQA